MSEEFEGDFDEVEEALIGNFQIRDTEALEDLDNHELASYLIKQSTPSLMLACLKKQNDLDKSPSGRAALQELQQYVNRDKDLGGNLEFDNLESESEDESESESEDDEDDWKKSVRERDQDIVGTLSLKKFKKEIETEVGHKIDDKEEFKKFVVAWLNGEEPKVKKSKKSKKKVKKPKAKKSKPVFEEVEEEIEEEVEEDDLLERPKSKAKTQQQKYAEEDYSSVAADVRKYRSKLRKIKKFKSGSEEFNDLEDELTELAEKIDKAVGSGASNQLGFGSTFSKMLVQNPGYSNPNIYNEPNLRNVKRDFNILFGKRVRGRSVRKGGLSPHQQNASFVMKHYQKTKRINPDYTLKEAWYEFQKGGGKRIKGRSAKVIKHKKRRSQNIKRLKSVPKTTRRKRRSTKRDEYGPTYQSVFDDIKRVF